MSDSGFFTPAMGARLRKLRVRASLTQEELADRMGLNGANRRLEVGRLESGCRHNPSLETVARYLRACGARWSQLTDLLEVGEDVPVELETIRRAGLPEDVEQELKDATEHQMRRHQERLPYSWHRSPISPDRRRRTNFRGRNKRFPRCSSSDDALVALCGRLAQ